MKILRTPLLLAVVLASAAGTISAYGSEGPVGDFRLLDQLGNSHELYLNTHAKAVVILAHGVDCPIVSRAIPLLMGLKAKYEKEGVVFLMLNANPSDDRERIEAHARKFGYDIPVLKDDAQVVARSLGLTRTGEVLVLDPKSWNPVFRGPISDSLSYESMKKTAPTDYLDEALSAIIHGHSERIPASLQAWGCLISFGKPRTPSYSTRIAPILLKHCASCHDGRNAQAWRMDSYETVKSWSSMMRETLMTQRMPPWGADPAYGHFDDDPSISPADQRALIDWIDADCPRGGGADPLSARRPPTSKWKLGKPDIILSLDQPQKIPASGNVDFHYVKLLSSPFPSGTKDGLWVEAMEFAPTDPAVTHHEILFAYTDESAFNSHIVDYEGMHVFVDRATSQISGWIPGTIPKKLPSPYGFFVPKDSHFIMEGCYVPTGKPEVDKTEIGLYLRKSGVSKPIHNFAPEPTAPIRIPPFAASVPVEADTTLDKPIVLIAIAPHMHYRGKSIRVRVQFPDGKSKILLSVPNFSVSWQREYVLKHPLRLPKGTKLEVSGEFDNSADNPQNPDPSQTVVGGIKDTDEMFVCRFFYGDEGGGPR